MAERVLFGVGVEAEVATALVDLGAERVLLVALEHHADGARRVEQALGARCVGLFTTSVPQVPEDVAAAAVARARDTGADWVVAHGGGTPIGVAKAVALELDVRVGAVPTTYAGSERTDIWGVARGGVKATGRDPRVRPSLVAYDPALTVGLDRTTSLESLFNALAHSVDALLDPDAPPHAVAAAEASLPLLDEGLRAVGADPSDLGARTVALRGAMLASEALGSARMALQHRLAHVLAGSFGTAHAATHAVLLPYTLGFNAPSSERLVRATHRAWGTLDPAAWVYDLARSLGVGTSLRDLGLSDGSLERVVDAVLESPLTNPRPLGRGALGELLLDALHDRRPSALTRRMSVPGELPGPHGPLAVSVRGAPVERASAVVLALHGRGASADRFLADLERRVGPREGVCWVAPQAHGNAWYPKSFFAPLGENQPGLGSALDVVEALYAELVERVPPERIVLVGFSQGACLLLTWLSRTRARPARALAFTGAPTPLPDASWDAADGLRVHLGRSDRDPWVPAEAFDAVARQLRQAGARVDVGVVVGADHGIHPPDDAALRAALDELDGDGLRGMPGFRAAHQTEARPGALPRHQNSPKATPYGLFTEQVTGTGFTVHRADNLRTWLYRLRPTTDHGPWVERPSGRFVGRFDDGVPHPEGMRFRPLALPDAPTDFLAGLTTFAGAGDPTMRQGAALHLYAANADMERTAFASVDGDLVLIPQLGRLRIRTELGVLSVRPGSIALIPRGLRFLVELPDGPSRGFVGEVYGVPLTLPARGVVGSNGLADERHFVAPVAAYVDDAAPWTLVVASGGRLWECTSPHGPFDVVAWHGTWAPYVYDLQRFNSLGSVSFDHPDPSILTVLTAPFDGSGRSALDLAVFRGRWDASEHTFRPPFFHRNSAVELNGVIRSPAGSRWEPGAFTWTPTLAPHGVHPRAYQDAVLAPDTPERIPDDSLWIQFESAFALKVLPWMLEHPARDHAHLGRLGSGWPPPVLR